VTLKQTTAVLNWLKARGPITPKQAEHELGIMRLAARINDIKNGRGVDPHPVETRLVRGYNEAGERCRFAEYRLAPRASYDLKTGQGYLALPQE
jgi:hypothetical protein